MKLNKQIFGWLGASALLLTTACSSNETFNDVPDEIIAGQVYGTGNSLVTLTLNSETAVSTRGYVDYDGELSHISDGTKARDLYFAVYEKTSASTNPYVEYVGTTSEENIKFPYTIRLSVDADKEYKIAIWAQNSAAKTVFNTQNLQNVKVDYSNAKNNDELRDAFCASQEFAGNAQRINMVLHRPFAQLNVGTTGADYKEYVNGHIYPHRTITFSKIEVDGVYDQINVLTDEISRSTEFNGKATFEYAEIPALYGQESTPTNFTEAFSSTNGSREEEFLVVKLNEKSSEIASSYKESQQQENKDNVEVDTKGFLGFKTNYPTMFKNNYLTEKFRYLSMCYVLVPNQPESGKELNGWPSSKNSYDKYSSSILNSVSVYFAEKPAPTEEEIPETGQPVGPVVANGYKYFTISNVPVHRNWRTNLLGGLAEPKNPDDPDDPSSLFANVQVLVNLCPIFFDEYNGLYDPEENTNWSGIGQGNFPGDETTEGNLHDELNKGSENK